MRQRDKPCNGLKATTAKTLVVEAMRYTGAFSLGSGQDEQDLQDSSERLLPAALVNLVNPVDSDIRQSCENIPLCCRFYIQRTSLGLRGMLFWY
jgi:hypothetical protein